MYSPKQKMSNFLDCPESFWIVWKVSGLSGQFLDCPDSFCIVRKVFRLSMTVSRLSGQFVDCPKSFWIVWNVSGLSGQFLDCPDRFWIVRTVSLPTGRFQANICFDAKTFLICKNVIYPCHARVISSQFFFGTVQMTRGQRARVISHQKLVPHPRVFYPSRARVKYA